MPRSRNFRSIAKLIALETTRAIAHLAAPNDELKVERALAKLVEEVVRRRILQGVGCGVSNKP
jgi:hypothetical protein